LISYGALKYLDLKDEDPNFASAKLSCAYLKTLYQALHHARKYLAYEPTEPKDKYGTDSNSTTEPARTTAENTILQALGEIQKFLGEGHPDTLAAKSNLAWT
jgi:hypothetical protein